MKKFTKLLKEKRWRWTAGGIVCLVVAAMIFALGSGFGTSAVTLNGTEITLPQTNDVYEIDEYNELKALGDASSIETSGKTFKLVNDITVPSMTTPATGTFAGIFDGNGHVITINSVSELSNSNTGAVSEGLLFGTVSGTVRNLIVDIKTDVKYTRASTVGVSSTGTSDVKVTKEAVAPYSGSEEFSSFSSDDKAKQLAVDFNSWVSTNNNIITSGGKTYYRVSRNEEVKKTTTYDLNALGTDQFGIICGTLDSNAQIDQVYVKGDGVLNVIQNAGKVSNTKVASGTREKYFYYEKNTGSYVEEVQPSATTVNAPTVIFYDKNAKVDDNSNTDSNGVKISVSAPKYVEKDGDIVYIVNVVNGNTSEISISNLTSTNTSGAWTKDGVNVNWTTEKISKDSSQIYEYTISGVTTNISGVTFTLNYNYIRKETVGGEETTVSATPLTTSNGLEASVVDTSSPQVASPSGEGLKLTLTPEKANYLANGSVNVTYTLTLSNQVAEPENANARVLKIKKDDIVFNIDNASQTIAWTQNNQNFSETTIGPNGNITLKGTLTLEHTSGVAEHKVSVTVTPSVQENTYTNVATYKYIEGVPDSQTQYGAENYETAVDGPAEVTKGNHLNSGIIAGTSKGSITNTKQDMLINGSSYDGNTAELNVGGIVGKAEGGTASNLFILGTQNYAGKNSTLPTDSIIEGGTKPNDTNWTSYSKFESTGEKANEFDLAWLVKAEKESSTESEGIRYFTYSDPVNGAINVEIPLVKRITGKDLKYTVAYNARKSLDNASEDEIYVDNNMELGQSGYYRHINSYATDGYYHYTAPVVTLNAVGFVYPYIAEFSSYNMSAEVKRTNNPLNDKVEITFTKDSATVSGLNGKIYYEINSTVIPTSESDEVDIKEGLANIPFEISPSSYRITPVIGEYIYPTQITQEFNNREPLPEPLVTCFDYYDKDGNKNPYVSFKSNGTYEAGTDMQITPQDNANYVEDYTLRYKFSATALTGTDRMKNASEYSGTAVIPDTLAGSSAYLYVEVSKKNYDSEIYSYGPFNVKEKVYLVDYLNGVMAEEGDENHRVVNDDIVTFKVNPENTNYVGIQYIVSKMQTPTGNWTDYIPNEGIVLSENAGGYIYSRIKYDVQGERFGEPQLFDFTFGSGCASPIITPNTGLKTSGEGAASTIEPTTLIGLSSRTKDATVYYVKSNPDDPSQSMTINMERTTAPTNGSSDGTIEGEYKYFTVNNRWYRTKNQNVEKYTEGINLSHSKDEPTYMYITAVAVASGYDISDELTFIYKVKQPQQVKVPEAAFETRFTPGGEAVETSTVSKGGKLSFYSVTPGATLYYAVGTEGGTWNEMPKEGVTVDGEYGGNFVVRVQAKKFSKNETTGEQVEVMLPSDIVTFIYKLAEQEQANAPTATPGTSTNVPTTVIPGNKILLSTNTKGAAIFFTTDGSTPQVKLVEITNEDGTISKEYQPVEDTTTKLYSSSEGIVMPSNGTDYFTITAIAVKEGLGNSPEARFTYVYPDAVLAPYTNIDSGKVELNTKVLLKNLTDGAVIYYNVAYGAEIKEEDVEEPTFSSTVFNEEYPFTITQKTIIKAMAAKDGVKSSIVTFTFDPMAQLTAPTASIETGSVVSNGTVLQLIAAKGATIYYTIDGSDPTEAGNAAVMSGNSVTLNGEPGGQVTIKAFAKATDNSQSEVVTFTYQFSQNTLGGVTANVETGSTVSNGTKIILMSDVTGAEIYYTTDGSAPAEHGKKGTTVEVNGTPGSSFTIKAVAMVDGKPGIVTTFIYKIEDKPDEPTASPAGGTLTVATRVSLDSSEEKIYYTIDGTEPTKSSNLYSEPILINRTTTLKAIAVSKEGEVSDVATFQYMAAPRAGMPKADFENGQLLDPGTKVRLWTDTPNAVIYYTTDGTDPTVDNLDSLLVYDADGIDINRSVTVKAVAQAEGMQLSRISSWNYIVETIPAVEIKKEEAAKLAEEGLQDTDAKGLERKNEKDDSNETKRILKEKEYKTMLVASKENIADNAVLYTEEKETNPMTIKNVKKLFGDDYTILSEYEIRLKSGKNFVQPTGNVEVVIPIPDGYENATLTVVSVNTDKKLTTLETRRENGMLYASTASLKDFAVVGIKAPEENSVTFPYLLLLELIAGGVLLFGVGYYGILKWKKHKNSK